MIARSDLKVGMRVTVVPWRGQQSYFCGHSGEIRSVTGDDLSVKYVTPDVRVLLDGKTQPMGFWAQELAPEGEE